MKGFTIIEDGVGRSRKAGLPPQFRALLVAAAITNLGDGLRLAALPLLAATLTSDPVLIGGLTAAQFLPSTTYAPFGGVIVDRSDRRRLILVTQTWRAVVMGLLAVALLADRAAIWQLFIVAFVITVGEILVDPSVVATVPRIDERRDLDRANGRLTTVETVTNEFAGGPLGALTFALAPWLPFVLDAVSYLGSVAPFRRLPSNPTRPARAAETSSVRTEMGEGFGWIRSHPFLWPLTTGIAVFHLGTAGAFTLLILLVVDVLDAPDVAYGVALAASAIGATLAGLVAAPLVERSSRRRVMTGAAGGATVTVAALAAVGEIWHLVLLWALNGFAAGVMLSIGRGFVQRHTPDELLGRAAIASRVITRTSFVVGALVAGVVASWTSVRWSFVAAGGFHLVGTTMLWRSFRHEPLDARA